MRREVLEVRKQIAGELEGDLAGEPYVVLVERDLVRVGSVRPDHTYVPSSAATTIRLPSGDHAGDDAPCMTRLR